MLRVVTLAGLLGIILALGAAIHYYLWLRLVRDLELPGVVTRSLTVLLGLLWASLPLSFWLSRALPPERGLVLLLVIYTWMGLMLYLLLLLGVADVLRGLAALAGRVASALGRDLAGPAAHQQVQRARMTAGAVLLFAVGLSVAAWVEATRPPRVREVVVRLPRLPARLEGTVLVLLSDLHLGPTLRRDFLRRVVERTNGLSPDLVAITGDLADGSVERLGEMVAPLAELRARWGVFFVTGNHEYYGGADAWCRHLAALGLRVLRGERVSIGWGKESFDLVGLDDLEALRFDGGQGTRLDRALAGRDPRRELVLLAHQPRVVHEASQHGVGLQLSGHTHGGQLWPWSVLVHLQQPVVSGLVRHRNTLVYVSNGTGHWGPPMRLGAPAEITRVVLRRGPLEGWMSP